MDYNKINTITTDGQGNIVLQDVHANNIVINKNNTEELEQLVGRISKEQLLQIRKIFEKQSSETTAIMAVVQKELDARKRKTKILSIALGLSGILILVVVFIAYQNYMQEFGFTIKLKSYQNAKITEGKLTAIFDDRQFTAEVTPKGEAVFTNIPAKYKNEAAKFLLSNPLHENSKPDSLYLLRPNAQYILDCAYKNLNRVFGVVKDENNIPVENVYIAIAEQKTKTNELGKFEIQIPAEKQQPELRLTAFKAGYELWDRDITVDATVETHIILKK